MEQRANSFQSEETSLSLWKNLVNISALKCLCFLAQIFLGYVLLSHLADSRCGCMNWKNSPAVFAPLSAKCRNISEINCQYSGMPKKGGMDKWKAWRATDSAQLCKKIHFFANRNRYLKSKLSVNLNSKLL